MNKSDFIAELKFKATENGGRRTPAHSGYRPHIEFNNYPEYPTSGQQTYIGKKTVNPGETINAEIGILGTEYFSKRLYKGMQFKFCEGKNIIGFGEIINVLNKNLEIVENEKIANNLNLYPKDIVEKIKSIYSGFNNESQIIQEIQELINTEKAYRSPRIVRAMIYLFTKGKIDREKVFDMVKTDWRDVLFYAEYDNKENRLRDFSNEFGKEEIKASR